MADLHILKWANFLRFRNYCSLPLETDEPALDELVDVATECWRGNLLTEWELRLDKSNATVGVEVVLSAGICWADWMSSEPEHSRGGGSTRIGAPRDTRLNFGWCLFSIWIPLKEKKHKHNIAYPVKHNPEINNKRSLSGQVCTMIFDWIVIRKLNFSLWTRIVSRKMLIKWKCKLWNSRNIGKSWLIVRCENACRLIKMINRENEENFVVEREDVEGQQVSKCR